MWLRCVRTERFKLVQTLVPDEEPFYRLYDLETDPGEKEDVAPRFPEQLRRLKVMLHTRVFAGERLRSWLLAADSAGSAAWRAGAFPPELRCEVISPAEGEIVTHAGYNGKVPVSWTGPDNGEFIIQYEVGRGKYHLEGSFPIHGNRQTFGPFNRVFWKALPLYNPWRFRVVPKDRPDLAGAWRTFSFE